LPETLYSIGIYTISILEIGHIDNGLFCERPYQLGFSAN
jgi:hypothetical protein